MGMIVLDGEGCRKIKNRRLYHSQPKVELYLLIATLSQFIKLVEVGPRDGLQNEKSSISSEVKTKLVDLLSISGLKEIETGSFVSPKWVPQMASSDQVFKSIRRLPGVIYSALTPNAQGFEAALAASVDQVAIFAAASESFSQKNINCSIEQSIERFKPIVERAKTLDIPVRAYISCTHGCPYEGEVDPKVVINTAQKLLELGCFEVSLGDTTGVGTPFQTKALLKSLSSEIPLSQIAMHFHDTYGLAIANIFASLELGIKTFDASVAGLGGCPYAKGASGNVASEDVVYLLQRAGFDTGIDLDALIRAGN